MSRFDHSRTVAATAVAGLLLALTGCSGDDPGSKPEPSPSASSETASEAASESASASPTEEASPTIAPATGPLLKLEGAQMNAPAGWKPLPDIVEFATEANPPTGIGAARLNSLAFPGTVPLDDMATSALKGSDKGKRQPDVEIAGEEFYHLAGKISDFRYYEEFGTVANGYQVIISFDLQPEMPAAERQQLIAESLASFAWQ